VTWPGLAKTQLRQLVTVQQRRRHLLERQDVQVHALIDEAALLRSICPANVMTAQLEHLAAIAGSPQVTVQVATLDTRWPVLSPSFALLGFPDEEDGVAACYRTATGQLIVTQHHADTGAPQNAFSALAKAALTPTESVQLIKDMIASKTDG
jgi:hypothetical protein